MTVEERIINLCKKYRETICIELKAAFFDALSTTEMDDHDAEHLWNISTSKVLWDMYQNDL